MSLKAQVQKATEAESAADTTADAAAQVKTRKRTKGEKPKAKSGRDQSGERLNLVVDPELRRRLKILAAEKGVTMGELAEAAIRKVYKL